jgi:hypothetical protein
MSTDIAAAGVAERALPAPAPAGVPWRTVLPLAVVLVLANTFWIVSLRGAVGAIERTQTPFLSWVRESALSLPLFVLAVLGGLTLALHWFGPSGHRPRQVALTGLLVACASTLAGVAVLAASTFYDYLLELDQEAMMGAMRQTCSGACLTAQDEATFWLQLRSFGWGTLILLVTNVVLVAWAVAACGGRLRVSTPRPAGSHTPDRNAQLRALLIAGLVGSAVIHAAVVPEHLTEWSAAGSFFVLLTAAELAVAGWLLLAPRIQAGALLAAAAVSAGPLLLWFWSRTTGLPFGPEPGEPEAIGLADCAACLLEVLTLVLAVVLLRRVMRAHRTARRGSGSSRHAAALALTAVVTVTVVGVAGTSLSWASVLVEGSSHMSQDAGSSHEGHDTGSS